MHWRVHRQSLSPEFFSLIESLQEISRRWRGYGTHDSAQSLCLATKYSFHLKELHAKCVNEENVGSDLLGYPDVGGLLPPLSIPNIHISSLGQTFQGNITGTPKDINHSNRPSLSHHPSANTRSPSMTSHRLPQQNVSTPTTAALSSEFANTYVSPGGTIHPMTSSSKNLESDHFSGLLPINISNPSFMGQNSAVETVEDELTAMSNLLLGQQFLEMDRVIPFDGTNFNYQEMCNW